MVLHLFVSALLVQFQCPLGDAFTFLQPSSALLKSQSINHGFSATTSDATSTSVSVGDTSVTKIQNAEGGQWMAKSSDPDQWIRESLEKEDRCVIGPKEVLVYDTTLRGTSYYRVKWRIPPLKRVICGCSCFNFSCFIFIK